MAKSASGRRKRKQQQQQQQQQDFTVWDRFWLWVKVNEKMMWVLLLLLIAPAFAFTGATASFFDQQGGSTREAEIFGHTVNSGDKREIQDIIRSVAFIRGRSFFGEGAPLDWVDFMLLEREAERLGIMVSDEELGAAIRTIYQSIKAARETESLDPALARLQGQRRQERFMELRKADAWDAAEWRGIFLDISRRGRIPLDHPRVFEVGLRRHMAAERVIGYVQQTVHVTEDEVREEFQRTNKFRKLSFFQVKPEEATIDEIAASLTDEEVEKYYEDNLTAFDSPFPRAKVDYVFIPYEAFADTIEISEDDIISEYEAVRGTKYRRGLVDEEVDSFNLLTPEQEKARAEKLFRPLEEVRDEVVEAVTEKKKLEAARALANTLRNRMFPATGEADDGSAKSSVTMEKLKADHDFLETGSSPFMMSYELSSKFADYSSYALTTLLQNLMSNANEPDVSKHKPVTLSKTHSETEDKKGLVIYANLRTLDAGIPDLEDVKDDARERLAKQRAMDALEEKLDALATSIQNGEVVFAEAGKERDAKVHQTAFITRADSIQIPVEKDEDEAEAAADDNEPKTQYFRGTPTVRAEGFLIEERGPKGVTLARDDGNDAFYLVRLDDELDPDPKDFDKKREGIENQLLANRRAVYFRKWLADLYKRAGVKHYRYVEDEGVEA